MAGNKNLIGILKAVIWLCLGVILFSPLYVSSQLFFPFISTKTYAFQISVEVMLFAYLLLCLADTKYRIHTNLTVMLMGAYLIILTIASAFSGNDFYHSFWSNNERGDGILMLLHLFLFSVVLTGFFRSVKEWLWLFDLFIVASFCVGLVALDQYLGIAFPGVWIEHWMSSSNGARLAATIGNSGYVGGYMVFGVFLSLFMALKRSQLWAKSWYVFVLLLELFIAIQTQTRGAYLALALGAGISAVYLLWFYYNDKRLKIALVALIIAALAGLSGIFIFKDSDFVKNKPILRRVASISLTDGTANNRMVTWGIGWKGFMEKPLLGWGQENFYQAFDKYYTTKNTEQWFDRCHNMICDRATTGGILGLLSYLALLILPFFAIWKYYRREYADKTEIKEKASRRYLTPIIFTILIVAYIIQNMFIFEALATYVPLIMVLSFVGLYSKGWDLKFWDKREVKLGLAAGAAIFLVIAIPYFNLQPLYANADFIKALISEPQKLETKIDAFEEVLSRQTMGNQEYRKHYFSFYEQNMMGYVSQPENRTAESDQLMAEFANKMEAQMNAQLSENPHNVSNNLLYLRFCNSSYYFNIDRLNRALQLAEKSISLSPGRPQIYYDVATNNYYLGNYYQSINDTAKANEQFRLSMHRFYQGASQNVKPLSAFDQLAQFLVTISGNNTGDQVAQALVESDIGGVKATDITAQMLEWQTARSAEEDAATVAGRTENLKVILRWLLKADPKNEVLASQLKSIE